MSVSGGSDFKYVNVIYEMISIHMVSQKEIMLLVVYQDGYTYKAVPLSCTAQDNLFTEITRHCQFTEWDKMSARIGRAEMDVCQTRCKAQDQKYANSSLQHVLTAFLETAPPIVCTVTVTTKNRPAPMSRL